MKVLDLNNPFDAPVYHKETVSSTFDTARLLAAANERHGTVITADFQEAGRGRQNRSWIAERGKNLMFTILLRYGDFSSIPKALTLKTGLAVSLAVEDLTPSLAGQVFVKWPNDVMISPLKARDARKTGAYKVSGILTEYDGNNVYIGVGVNVAQKEFPEEYSSRAGSVIHVFPDLSENARFILLEKILFRLYGEIRDALNNTWHERILDRLYKKGETVTFADGPAGSDRLVKGVLSGLNPDGELLIIPCGETKTRSFVTGELQVY